MIDRFGYNVASKKIESRLYEMELTDWYYTVSVLTNLKLSMTLNNRNKLISNLRKRIKTGI
jgi:hypothetical protein